MSLPPGDPEDLVVAFALGTLDEGERGQVEAHLNDCHHCSALLADMEGASVLLSGLVPRVAPPPHQKNRVMEAVGSLPPVFPPARGELSPPDRPQASPRFTFSNFAMPLAATLVVGLLTASLILNVVTTSRLNSLEQQEIETKAMLKGLEVGHAETNASMAQLASESHQADSALRQVIETSYLMARPFTQPYLLQPTNGASDSEGVVLVANDGMKAMLLVANMEPPPLSQTYQVWLARDGQHLPVGSLVVDSTGWGTMTFNPPESLYDYDWMSLTMDQGDAAAGVGGEMVLQTRIISPADR